MLLCSTSCRVVCQAGARCHPLLLMTGTSLRPTLQVLLNPPRHELEQRLLRRAAAGGHFTPGAALLDSQLAVLEYEEDELLLHVRGDPFPSAEQIVAAVFQRCGRAGLAG